MQYHIMYMTKDGFKQAFVECGSFKAAEKWAEDNGALNWEIGQHDEDGNPLEASWDLYEHEAPEFAEDD